MGCQSEVKLGDNLTFSICCHDPDTGVLTDADSAPTYRIYEDETTTAILNGTMAKLDDSNTTGFYTEQVACSTENGFEVSKSYTIYIQATVDSDTGGICYGFLVRKIASDVWDATDADYDTPWTMGHRVRQQAVVKNMNPVPKVWDDERAGELLELPGKLAKLENLDMKVSGVAGQIKPDIEKVGKKVDGIRIPEPPGPDPRLENLDAPVSSIGAKVDGIKIPEPPPPDPRLDKLAEIDGLPERTAQGVVDKIIWLINNIMDLIFKNRLPSAQEIAGAVLDEEKGEHQGWLTKLLSKIDYIAKI